MDLGATGIELDVQSDNREWYVHHDRPTGLTFHEYLNVMKHWPQWPALVYLDIKTPHVENLAALAQAITWFPQTTFVFSTARGDDARALLSLPMECVLCVDFVGQQEAHALFNQHNRRAWLADGIAAGFVNPLRALRNAWPFPVEGRIAWTYSSLAYWEADVVDLKLNASIVSEGLLPRAAERLNTVC